MSQFAKNLILQKEWLPLALAMLLGLVFDATVSDSTLCDNTETFPIANDWSAYQDQVNPACTANP